MQVIKIIFLSILTLGVLGAGGYFGYKAAYAQGETSGYETGYSSGEEAGYATGEKAGYESGYSTGEENGYSEGYDKGYDNGYEEGEETGYEAGYALGESTGYQEGYSLGHIEGGEAGYISGYDKGIIDALGHDYTLRDPTYSEVILFLNQDTTDSNEYIEGGYGVYVCSHYSRDAGNAAEQAGYRCAYIELRYIGSGHAIIAFNTVDQGMVFFDPQTDERVIPEIGKRYYECVIPRPGYFYVAPSFDDTIQDILVIW